MSSEPSKKYPNFKGIKSIKSIRLKEEPKKKELISINNFSNSYMNSLYLSTLPGSVQALTPFDTHSYVFSAVFITALTGSQAPFKLWENMGSDGINDLETSRKRFGSNRNSFYNRKLYSKTIENRLLNFRGLKQISDSPLARILNSPNEYINGQQLMFITLTWLQLRGEIFWVLTNKDGGPVIPGETPEKIWPLNPDFFKEIYEFSNKGELVGWELKVPKYMFKGTDKIQLDLSQVVQFKFPDPENPLRGVSRLKAVIRSISLDIDIDSMNSALILNGGEPSGVLYTDHDLDETQRDSLRSKFEARHSGKNRRKVAVLSNGLKYSQISLSPEEMQFLERKKLTRLEVLAALGVPESVLGISDSQTYATQLGQNRNFWDKTILPMLYIIEREIEFSLLYTEPDSLFGAFDLTGIEALRVGVIDKINAAAGLCGNALHMPPRQAFEIVGIEVPKYVGDDVALIAPGLAKTQDVIDGLLFNIDPNSDPGTSTDADPLQPLEDTVDQEDTEDNIPNNSNNEVPTSGSDKKRALKAKITWVDIVAAVSPHEKSLAMRHKRWGINEKRRIFDRIDALDSKKAKDIETKILTLEGILIALQDSANRLKSYSRPVYTNLYKSVMSITIDELGGTPLFDPADPRFIDILNSRERVYVESVTKTVRLSIRNAIAKSLLENESVELLKTRISEIFDIQLSEAKLKIIARTEMWSLNNSMRNTIFTEQGVSTRRWENAGDEKVRKDHITFGSSGEHPVGFNYLDLVGKSGILTHPGDINAPIEQIAGCRCIERPVLK